MSTDGPRVRYGPSTRSVCARAALLVGLLQPASLGAGESLRWGLQGGLLMPASPDLQLTTGSGPSLGFGARLEWGSYTDQSLRLRLDREQFRAGRQIKDSLAVHQEMDTKVHDESLGLEQLFHQERWFVGLGLYGIRWTVDATNRLTTLAGTFSPSGSSRWTRAGVGLLVGRRWNANLGAEVRFVASRYGQENQPTRVASLNLVWSY